MSGLPDLGYDSGYIDAEALYQSQLAAKDAEIERLKIELKHSLDFDPDGMVSKIKQQAAEIERLKSDNKQLWTEWQFWRDKTEDAIRILSGGSVNKAEKAGE